MFYEPAAGEPPPPPFTRDPFKALVMPRPIGWISTLSVDGIVNLAPFSYFNAVSDRPPTVMYCPSDRADGSPKDSRVNAETTLEFVFNLSTWKLRQQMSDSSETLAPEVDELAMTGLTPTPSRIVKAPGVAESPVRLECVYQQTVDLPGWDGSVRDYIVIGRVVGVHVDDDVIVDGLIDVRRLKPVARLGYMDYAVVEDFFTMTMPP